MCRHFHVQYPSCRDMVRASDPNAQARSSRRPISVERPAASVRPSRTVPSRPRRATGHRHVLLQARFGPFVLRSQGQAGSGAAIGSGMRQDLLRQTANPTGSGNHRGATAIARCRRHRRPPASTRGHRTHSSGAIGPLAVPAAPTHGPFSLTDSGARLPDTRESAVRSPLSRRDGVLSSPERDLAIRERVLPGRDRKGAYAGT